VIDRSDSPTTTQVCQYLSSRLVACQRRTLTEPGLVEAATPLLLHRQVDAQPSAEEPQLDPKDEEEELQPLVSSAWRLFLRFLCNAARWTGEF
jgi:hypothetical protein